MTDDGAGARRTDLLLEVTPAPAVELACLASLAVRMEPELLRAVRLAAAPQLDAAAEADLWFSRLVASRGADAISLVPEVSEHLRRRLRARPDRRTVERAWEAIEHVHRSAAPALVLEERIARLTVLRPSGWQQQVQAELDRALATLAARPVPSVARWAARACPRLPQEVQDWPSALQLREAAAELSSPAPVHGRPVPELDVLARSRPTRLLRLQRTGRFVWVGSLPPDRAVAVPVPDTEPVLLDLRWSDEAGARSEQVAVRSGGIERRDVGTGPVQLRSLGGAVFDLPAPGPTHVEVLEGSTSLAVASALAARLRGTGESVRVLSRTSDAAGRWQLDVPDPDGWVLLLGGELSPWAVAETRRRFRGQPLLPVLLEGDPRRLPSELPVDLDEIQVLDLRTLASAWPRSETALVDEVARAVESFFGTIPASAPQQRAGAPSPGRQRRWLEVVFDAEGVLRPVDGERLLARVRDDPPRHVVLCTHGWNHDAASARRLFDGLSNLLDEVRARTEPSADPADILFVGIRWPSMLWVGGEEPDETVPASGDAQELTGGPAPVFPQSGDDKRLEELQGLLDRSADDLDDLERSRRLLVELDPSPDERERLRDGSAAELFERFADETATSGGGDGWASPFGRLWEGAKRALRTVTYGQVQRRAVVVGRDGLAPLLARLSHTAPEVRVHLVGHSLGAQLLTSALDRLGSAPDVQPVASLTLLQAALPAWLLAEDRLVQERFRRAVGGPCLATRSAADTAMSTFYPYASRLTGRSSASPEPHDALGAVGFHGVEPHEQLSAQPVGRPYGLRPGWFYTVDCTDLITAHADVLHPELAWLLLAAQSSDSPA